MTTSVCVKVASLRELGYDHLEDWINDPKNVYVGRRGRIWITCDGDKRIYHYEGSKWHNPFTVREYGLDKAMKLYKKKIQKMVKGGEKFKDLKGKNLGCFCDQSGECHAKYLAEVINGLEK